MKEAEEVDADPTKTRKLQEWPGSRVPADLA
jgi:hypothetical protein